MEESLTDALWVWLRQLLHAQVFVLHWQLFALQELTMKGGYQQNGNATRAKDRTSSYHHRSKPFQRRLFVEVVFRRRLLDES